MILLHIVTENVEQAKEISDFLLNKKLILNPFTIKESVSFSENSQVNFLLMCRTKALLFTKIDYLLKSKYPNNMPVLYSLPIVHMDWDQSQKLVDSIAPV